MLSNNRYPPTYALLAGLSGAIAWSTPYLIQPFIRGFPEYAAPPFHLRLIQLTISYAIAALLSGGVFFIGLRLLPIDPRHIRPSLSTRIVLVTILGMVVGNAFAILVGILTGYSYPGMQVMLSMGTLMSGFNAYPEPFHTICTIIGAGLATVIIVAFSGAVSWQDTPQRFRLIYIRKLVLKVCGMALIGRIFIDLIEFSFITKYTSVGQSVAFFFLVLAAGGALFGALTWPSSTKLYAA